MNGRTALARTVGACALGSAVSIFAATRTWAVQVQSRPAPLSPLHVSRTGSFFVPWLSALALVGLAGTGALLATRGRWRSLVGVLVAFAGIGVLAGAVVGLVAVDGVRPGWPLLCVPAGLLLLAGGGWAAARGGDWPAMGTRYEPRTAVPRDDGAAGRRARPPTPPADRDRRVPDSADRDRRVPDSDDYDDYADEDFELEEEPVHVERSGPSPSEIAMWDALDRGEDPSR
jgi:hypothetical protein